MKRPYRVFKRQGVWWMTLNNSAFPLITASTIDEIWQWTARCLNAVELSVTPFRHVE